MTMKKSLTTVTPLKRVASALTLEGALYVARELQKTTSQWEPPVLLEVAVSLKEPATYEIRLTERSWLRNQDQLKVKELLEGIVRAAGAPQKGNE